MYCIQNEINNINQALIHYQNLKTDFDIEFNKPLKGLSNKLDRFFNEEFYYNFTFEYNGYSFFQIENAIERLELWQSAIERENNFYIDEQSYKKFLEYMKESQKEL